jgi:tripartite-type tricarboxylate transporter receptor subunit TctC
MVAVPYQSVPPAIAALMTGTVQMFFSNISDVIEPARSGKIRLLGVSTGTRSSQFPDIPTIDETVPGFRMIVWHGIFAPAGTPEAIIRRLSVTLKAVSQDAEFARVLNALGIDTASTTPNDLTETIRSDRSLYRSALSSLGLLRKD